MKHYATYFKVIAFTLCIIPLMAMADTASTLRQLQIDLLWYSQVLTSGVLTPEKAAEVMAGLSAISAQLAALSVEPGVGGSSVFAPEAARRINIKSITVYGNPATMASTVQVVYNDELVDGILLPSATSTLRLVPPATTYSETETGGRIDQLMLNAKQSVLPGLAITPERYDELVQYSMKQYQSKEAVEAVLREVGEGNFPITIGDLSVITNVTAVAGRNRFDMSINSSEGESFRFSVGPHMRSCGGDEGGMCAVSGRYDFKYEYVVLGVVVDKLESTNFRRTDLVNDIIREELFLGAGELFIPAVTDERLVNELVDFMIGSEAYYLVDESYRSTADVHAVAAESCHQANVRNTIRTLITFYLGELQVSGPVSQILNVRAPVVYEDNDDDIYSRCEGQSNEFFPSFF